MYKTVVSSLNKIDTIGFYYAFCSAINAYKNGCIPIGCAIIDAEGNLVSQGENCQYTNLTSEIITDHPLAHAEINAILKTSSYTHENIESYILYSTLESCPLCFGAIVMGGIKNVRFAALDKNNEFVKLNNSVKFISNRNINIKGPFDKYQSIQIALIISRCLEKGFKDNEKKFDIYNSYCPEGVRLGIYLQSDINFHQLLLKEQDEEQILNYILNLE